MISGICYLTVTLQAILNRDVMCMLIMVRSMWLEYAYCKHHPVLQWLPTKLAEWIANKMQDELGFPDKADPRRGWTPAELKSILQNHVVRYRDGCALLTFGCAEWESELYRARNRGVMLARCYPWKMPKNCFHKMNPQVILSYP